MRTFHSAALIGAIAASAVACSLNSSDDPVDAGRADSAQAGSAQADSAQGGSSGSGICAPDTQSGSEACKSCFQEACGQEAQACDRVESCRAIFTCLQGCGPSDGACEAKCFKANADGQLQAFAYLGCAYATCHDECFCAGECVFGTAGACNGCLEGKCGSQCSGCDKDSGCMAMIMCFQNLGCGEMSEQEAAICMDDCAQEFQGGVHPFNEVGTCADEQCATECKQ